MLFCRNRTLLTCCSLPSLRYEQNTSVAHSNPSERNTQQLCACVFGIQKPTHNQRRMCVRDLCVSVGKSHFAPIFRKLWQNQAEQQDTSACICVRAHFLYRHPPCMSERVFVGLFLLIWKKYGFHASQSTVPTRWLHIDEGKIPEFLCIVLNLTIKEVHKTKPKYLD